MISQICLVNVATTEELLTLDCFPNYELDTADNHGIFYGVDVLPSWKHSFEAPCCSSLLILFQVLQNIANAQAYH